MCGRFTFEPTQDFYRRFHVSNRLDNLVARYNVAPGQMVPVVVGHNPNRIVLMRWGLIPHWAKEEKTRFKMINARVETLTQKPAYRDLLRHKRCLVPASGFYEWKEEGRGKTPYYIHPTSTDFIAFAGLYDSWTNPKGEAIATFTIITQDADAFMAGLHHRMPVVLQRELEDEWLAPHLTDPTEVLALLRRNRSVELDAHPVSPLVNKPSADGKALIQRIDEGTPA
jgi:putative SOS response-associated peptidase YedK